MVGALKQRFGQVWVNFGEPIHLDQFLDRHQPDWQDQDLGPEYRPDWLPQTTNLLASDVASPPQRRGGDQPGQPGRPGAALHQPPGLDESALARILDLYLALLRQCPTRPARPCRTATARP